MGFLTAILNWNFGIRTSNEMNRTLGHLCAHIG